MSTFGVPGLGNTGAAFAALLIGAGHEVFDWNRSPGSAQPLVEAGATAVEPLPEALCAPFSFSTLASDEAAAPTLSAATSGTEPGERARHGVDQRHRGWPTRGRGLRSGRAVRREPRPRPLGRRRRRQAQPAARQVERSARRGRPLLKYCGARRRRFSEPRRHANAVKVAVTRIILHVLQNYGRVVPRSWRDTTSKQRPSSRCSLATSSPAHVHRTRLDDCRTPLEPCQLRNGPRAEGPQSRRATRRRGECRSAERWPAQGVYGFGAGRP